MEWCGVGEEMERSVPAVRSRAVFTQPRITISIYEIRYLTFIYLSISSSTSATLIYCLLSALHIGSISRYFDYQIGDLATNIAKML